MKRYSTYLLGIILLYIITLAFLFCTFKHEQIELPTVIFKHWVHSYEHDTDTCYIYRPHDYPFPRSRGRRGFDIKENGEFVLYRIAPNDGLNSFSGRWKLKGVDTVIVGFKAEEINSFSFRIISCEEDILIIKK